MSEQLTIQSAKELLTSFSCNELKAISSESEKLLLQQAVELFTEASVYQNFGICADNVKEGFTALASYLQALNYEIPFVNDDVLNTEGAVYLKFNTRYSSYYLDSYTGKYRGVLVAFQLSENDAVNGTYGYLPLDLFMPNN